MNVLQIVAELELAFFDLPLDLLEPFEDLGGVLHRDDALAREHADVGSGTGDVVAVEDQVRGDGGGVGLDELIGRRLEAPAPHAGALGAGFGLVRGRTVNGH